MNLRRVNFFTLNYDTLIEQAADAEGVVLIDGFAGKIRPTFRPEFFEQDLYLPRNTVEGHIQRVDRVARFYKLHGSITWKTEDASIENPFGVTQQDGSDPKHTLIYPTPAKYGETLGMPYAELFRRFAGAVTRQQSVLVVLGYGFGDEHVNAIISQALSIPSFTLVIVDPSIERSIAPNQFVNRLRATQDQRLWLVGGRYLGTFEGFVQWILPNLREEEVQKRVVDTVRALRADSSPGEA